MTVVVDRFLQKKTQNVPWFKSPCVIRFSVKMNATLRSKSAPQVFSIYCFSQLNVCDNIGNTFVNLSTAFENQLISLQIKNWRRRKLFVINRFPHCYCIHWISRYLLFCWLRMSHQSGWPIDFFPFLMQLFPSGQKKEQSSNWIKPNEFWQHISTKTTLI